jgi:TPR repeat protein
MNKPLKSWMLVSLVLASMPLTAYAKESIHQLEKAAAQGDAGAENNLGVDYAVGQGVPQNYAKADYWYEKAASQGYAFAEYNLGFAYEYGKGVPQNTMTALHLFKKALAGGDSTAAYAIQVLEIQMLEHK